MYLYRFVIDSNAGYFMTVVVLDLISNQDISSTIQKAIWPFLRNLSLLDGINHKLSTEGERVTDLLEEAYLNGP